VPAFKDAVFPEFQTADITKELYDEWWNTINTPAFREEALATLGVMWRGALTVMSPEMSGKLVPFEKIVELLSNYGFEP